METIKNLASKYPNLVSWVVLAVGMVAILAWSARDVGFTGSQWTALIVTTILLAGACVWIISWEDDDEESEETPETTAKASEQAVTDKDPS